MRAYESGNNAAAAKSLQPCRTLCDPIDSSPPGSPIPGILQARTLEWVAISFSNSWKWKMKLKTLSHVLLLATPWTAVYQASPSMAFSKEECWSGVPLPSSIIIILIIIAIICDFWKISQIHLCGLTFLLLSRCWLWFFGYERCVFALLFPREKPCLHFLMSVPFVFLPSTYSHWTCQFRQEDTTV